MMPARPSSLATGLLGAALLLLAACGGEERGPSATPTAPRSTATAVPRTATPGARTTATPAATPQPPSRETPTGRPAPEILLPEGFAAFVVAEGLQQPTSLALGGDGRIYVSEEAGRVMRLGDNDGDGFFESLHVWAGGFGRTTGLLHVKGGTVFYVSHQGRVSQAEDTDGDGTADTRRDIVTGLPNGNHQNNGLALSPGGVLFVTNGSTCNECDEADERSATILQVDVVNGSARVYARGLRNPYDLIFSPDGRLWATDNGSDPPCNTIDELNLIVEGGDYGWPYSPGCDPFAKGLPPVADLGFNTASTGIAHYAATAFPPDYRGNFFITLWGSLGFAPKPGGHVLVRVILDEPGGRPVGRVVEFARGFQNPIDVTVDRDGSLLVLDYGAGRLYRILNEGPR